MTAPRLCSLLALAATGTALADPPPRTLPVLTRDPVPTPVADPAPAPLAAALTRPLVLSPAPLFGAPRPLSTPSVRLEAARVVAERFAQEWRFAEPGTLLGVGDGVWMMGDGYRPLSARAGALHAGSMGATLLGEILLGTGSPAAGVAALLAGATLDAAAADADRSSERTAP